MPFTDIHNHILPHQDDGSRSAEESLDLLERLYSQGFRSAVFTPHYSRRSQKQGLSFELQKKGEELLLEFSRNHPDFSAYPGQELFWHEDLPERLQKGYGCTINRGRFALTEFELSSGYDTIYRAVRRLQDVGYSPVIAHVERYPSVFYETQKLRELITAGAFLQMNYDTIQGSVFQKETRRARELLKNRLIHVLGTDAHRTDFRPPDTKEAFRWMEKHLNAEEILRITERNPQHMIHSEQPE